MTIRNDLPVHYPGEEPPIPDREPTDEELRDTESWVAMAIDMGIDVEAI